MLAIGLFAIIFGIRCTDNFLGKRFQLGFKFDFPRFVYYNLVNAVLSTIFYLFSVNFKLVFNLPTVLLPVIYAVTCFIGITLGVVTLKYITMPLNSVMSISGSLIGSNALGYIVLNEKVTLLRILALAAVILSVILPAREILHGKYKLTKQGVLCCIASFFSSMFSGVVSNLYLAFPNVDGKQYCTYTNIYLVVGCFIILMFYLISKKITVSGLLGLFKLGQITIIGSRSVMAFCSSLVTIYLLTLVPVSVHSIVAAALGMIATTIVSTVYYKEKLSVTQAFSLILLFFSTAVCAL
ncbi:MAG: hypothetical protein IKK24_06990 [Clostridia bacterium]|nr:hypothetical protein [Clostridia bacterium]